MQLLPTEGTISALNIPHSSIVFDLYQVAEIRAELLGEKQDGDRARQARRHRQLHVPEGIRVRPALSNARTPTTWSMHRACPEGLDAVVGAFARALAGKHAAVVERRWTSFDDALPTTERPRAIARDGPGLGGRSNWAKGRTLICARPERLTTPPAISRSTPGWNRVAANHASSSSDLLDSRKQRSPRA